MSILSPDPKSSKRDPFELDRLAEELAARENGFHSARTPLEDDDEANLDLGALEYVPLAHDNPYLTTKEFNVEDFLLSRSHTLLPDLRTELRDYLSTLKEELVMLINNNYADFISLSTDLRGEGVRLGRIKYPLKTIETEIKQSKAELRVIQDAIEAKLEKRAKLREDKTLLNLLLKISESVTRLESLLLIAVANPEDEPTSSPTLTNLKLPATEDHSDDVMRGNRSKHLGRVAAEYTQLLYHANKARLAQCAFVDEIQWKIDRIHSTLSSDLDQLFSSTILALTGDGGPNGKIAELEKAKLKSDLTECLRTYDVLGLWRDAEDVIRRDVVRTFVKKTVFSGSLSAPHSPLVPHTPFRGASMPSFLTSPSLAPPRTPYTPWITPGMRQTPIDVLYPSSSKATSPYMHLLNESDHPLANLYRQMLRFVERDLSRVMDQAEAVSVAKSTPIPLLARGENLTPQSMVPPQSFNRADGQGFDIMANVIWEEFARAILDDLGNVVFSVGRPNEFRAHYELTVSFIRALESFAPSADSVESMRGHPLYAAFERRWQLPVYFQLRWNEIINKMEEALSVTRIETSGTTVTADGESYFVTSQAQAIWIAISACWSSEIYIPELSHRFWRLSLQILGRYKTWIEESTPAILGGEKLGIGGSSLNSRTSTPVPAAEGSAGSPSEDSSMRKLAAVITDIRTLHTTVHNFWNEQICVMLPEPVEGGDGITVAQDALHDTLDQLINIEPPLSAQIIGILTKRCCEALNPMRSIPSHVRARNDKSQPTEASFFVQSVFRPVKMFFGIGGGGDGPGKLLKEHYLDSYASQIFNSVCQRYMYYLIETRKTEESLRKLKKGKQRVLFSPALGSGKNEEGRDEENIRLQMILDVEAFKREAEALGVQPDNHTTFTALNTMVHSSEAGVETI